MTQHNTPQRTAAAAHRCATAPFLLLLLCLAGSTAVLAQGPGGPGGRPGGPGGPGMGHNPGPPPPNGDRGAGGAPGMGSMGPRLAGPAGRWWDDGKYARPVGLTNDQQRRMDSVFQENRNALVSGLDTLRKAQARLDALSATDHPSEAAVLSEIQNVAQARADLAKTSAHMQLQIRNEMTNDQLNKLDKLK